jgi:hypothetical protein
MLTPLANIERYMNERLDANMAKIADGFCDIGRECVKVAKSLPQNGSRAQYPAPYERLPPHQPYYVDWTTNLRNSIGWAVLINGRVYKKDTGSIKNTANYLNELIPEYTDGVILLVMATGESPRDGRSYARYVQALGYDVLKTAELRAPDIAKRIVSKLTIDN